MLTQRYSVTQVPIETLFAWYRLGELAIPEIQRPFVWAETAVRDLLDSLLQGFPIGYLITWRNHDVRLKDGTTSSGKRILIDGQQRVTALMAALLGHEVVSKDFRCLRIRIAFHPGKREFEVSGPVMAKDPAWIPDIATVFELHTNLFDLVNAYCARNPGITQQDAFRGLELLKGNTGNQIGLVELAPDLDIETVTKIFIRVNSTGTPLSQADFAMAKIAVNQAYGGNTLRKAIDYFCHLAVRPESYPVISQDQEFAQSDFSPRIAWLRDEKDDLYDPSYTDMLRVAFTSEFQRGRLEDLVALLSGRNFETKQYEEAIVEESFGRLRDGIARFVSESSFKNFVIIIRSAGFVDPSLVGSQNALNFAYILYLALKGQGLPAGDVERQVRRWFVMSLLTGRYSGSPESTIDYDVRQIAAHGIEAYADGVIRGQLSSAFWDIALPQELDTSATSSPYFRVFRAAQVKMNDLGFLSRDVRVRELVEIKCDVHHVFPRAYLKKNG